MSLSLPMGVDQSILIIISSCALLLLAFTVLIRGMQKKGHPSANELMGRTITFWWMLGLMFLAVMTTPICVFIFLTILILLGQFEFLSFFRKKIPKHLEFWVYGLIAATTILSQSLSYYHSYEGFVSACFLPLLFLIPTIFVLGGDAENSANLMGLLGLTQVFFCFGLGHASFLYRVQMNVFLLTLILTEIRDLTSYWIGKFFSKHFDRSPQSQFLRFMNLKIAPKISPHKTWMTGLISTLLTIGLTLLSAPLLKDGLQSRTVLLIAWGAFIGFFGLLGDLVFSMVKRDFGLKDSGQILPGGTGVIDRIDSLVFTVPASAFLFFWFL